MKLHAEALRLPDAKARSAHPELVLAVLIRTQTERLDVEAPRPFRVSRGDPYEVELPDVHYPTEPSICSWMSRFISTAYSRGSSLVIGSTKPDTIMALASASDKPRLMR